MFAPATKFAEISEYLRSREYTMSENSGRVDFTKDGNTIRLVQLGASDWAIFYVCPHTGRMTTGASHNMAALENFVRDVEAHDMQKYFDEDDYDVEHQSAYADDYDISLEGPSFWDDGCD